MEEKKHILQEPSAAYGRKVRMDGLVFTPMEDMMETLRSQGAITHAELVEKLSKYL